MSTNKTPNYNLHSWTEQDGVQMSEMNENFAKLDQVVKEASQSSGEDGEKIDNIEERLDVAKSSSLTINPGLQVIQGKKNAPFNLSSIKGRSLLNLLGRIGNFETMGMYSFTNANPSIDTTIKSGGLSSLRSTIVNGFTAGDVIISNVSLKANKCYVLIAMIKNGTTTESSLSLSGLAASDIITSTTSFVPAVVKYKAASDLNGLVKLSVKGIGSQYSNFDEVRLYEIPESEYNALTGMTVAQIASKYPYVDSLQPVKNPYAIRYGENLLPPFYEWTLHANSKLLSPYEMQLDATASTQFASIEIPAIPGATYTLTHEVNDISKAWINWAWVNNAGVLTWVSQSPSLTATAPLDAVKLLFRTTNNVAGTFTYKFPMLVIGATSKPFKPREDSMVALQTDLYADPLTGATADEVFEKDGKYFKLSKWRNVVVDGNKEWALSSSETGIKVVYFSLPESYNPITWNPTGVKYDGSILTRLASGPDRLNGSTETPKLIVISVSSSDSGWGDSYTPTVDEIKAYFMGWKMYDVTVSSSGQGTYNGSGAANKRWAYRLDGVSQTYIGGIAYLPTTQAPNWTPYQLVYQLATPFVEPITSEGQLTLIEGSNQVEVGTGLVLREGVKPGYYSGSNDYMINDTAYNSALGYKVKEIFGVYRNNNKEYRAILYSGGNQYGNQKARINANDYDSSAAYTVTYLMLDKSTLAPLIGSIAENEKALLADLTDIVQQSASLSVVERSLSEALKAAQNKRNVWGPI